jgi:hypothetical protein
MWWEFFTPPTRRLCSGVRQVDVTRTLPNLSATSSMTIFRFVPLGLPRSVVAVTERAGGGGCGAYIRDRLVLCGRWSGVKGA